MIPGGINTSGSSIDNLKTKLRMNKATSVVKCLSSTHSYHAVVEVGHDHNTKCHVMSCDQSARLYKRSSAQGPCISLEVQSQYCDVRGRHISQQFVAFLTNSREIVPLWDPTTLRLFIATLAMEHPEFRDMQMLPAEESERFSDIFSMCDQLIDAEVSEIMFQTIDDDIYVFRCTHEGPDLAGDTAVKIESSRLKYDETWLG